MVCLNVGVLDVKLTFDGFLQELSYAVCVVSHKARCKHELSFHLWKTGPERITSVAQRLTH